MTTGITRTTRFAREWTWPGAALEEDELALPGHPENRLATRIRPRKLQRGPAWILLHGITRTGRSHVGLLRFARSLAAGGATVLIPEIPDWIAMDIAPERARGAVLDGIAAAESDPRVEGKPGLVGFSFGAPQALRTAGDPSLSPRLGVVAAFGGYVDLESTVEFLITRTTETSREP